jgi:hypothetical protein
MWLLLSTSLLACAACQPTAPTQPTDQVAPLTAAEPAAELAPGTEQQVAQQAGSAVEPGPAAPAEGSTDLWPSLLAEFVTADGGFRYQALVVDADARQVLNDAVGQIAVADLALMERDAKLAFLINAYNVLVVQSVVDAWPVDSVLNVPGFFDARTHRVAGMELTLNALENDHIRTMGDPRIHFAVNCASTSCPPLAALPYHAVTLDAELERVATDYVRATTRVVDGGGTMELSRIFEWFVDDFAAVGGIGTFVRSRLSDTQRGELSEEDVEITFAEYDWALNGR